MGGGGAALVLRNGALSIRQHEDLFLPLLHDCRSLKHLCKIHAHIIKSSLSHSNFLATRMIDVCSNLRAADHACSIFRNVIHPDLFVYNAIIRACSYSNKHSTGISIFKKMIEEEKNTLNTPDKFTYPFVIKSCAGIGDLNLGKQVQLRVIRDGLVSNLTIGNALLDMYARCGDMGDARNVFDEMSERNVVSWNCLISGHVRNRQMRKARALFDSMPERSGVSWTAMVSGYTRVGDYGEALEVFRAMQMAGVEADEVGVVSVLPACAALGALEVGRWVRLYCERKGMLGKTMVCNAVMEMYCRCGCVEEAQKVFGGMKQRDVISWSTMIAGLANHGKGREAIELFQAMRTTTTKPNAITFVAVLSACAHSGLVDQGLQYFESMKFEHGLEPSIHHYSCLVDLLGRSGQLDRALRVTETMPMRPDATVWGSLLSSCRTHRRLDVAEVAMERLLEFEPDDTGNYVLLSNIYADLGKWDGVSRIRRLMRSKSLRKTPGSSSIEVDNVAEEFISGHDFRSLSGDMVWVLDVLQVHLRRDHDFERRTREGVIVELF